MTGAQRDQPAAAPAVLLSPITLSVCPNSELKQTLPSLGCFLTAMKCVLFLLECVSPIELCSQGAVLCARVTMQRCLLYTYMHELVDGPEVPLGVFLERWPPYFEIEPP